MSRGTPRRLRMNRKARLQSAGKWLTTFTGRDVVKGYRKWYGVSTVCAIIELRLLGINVDEQRLIFAKRTEEEKARQRAIKKARKAKPNDHLIESDENFAFIAGYTEGGFPFGVNWEELEAHRLQAEGPASDRTFLDTDDDEIPF